MNNPRVLDAVGAISKFVSDHWESFVHYGEISDELFHRGFSSDEIEDAFLWIEQSTLGPKGSESDSKHYLLDMVKNPIRRLGPLEEAKIDTKAHGLLLSYLNKGLIDSALLEEIIGLIMQSDSPVVGQKEMRRITALTLFNRFQLEWKELLQNSNMLIH